MKKNILFYLLLFSTLVFGAAGDFTHNGSLRDSSNNQYVTNGTSISCERNIGSSTGADYCAAMGEWKRILVNTNATGDVTVYSGPAIVRSVRVRATNNAGTATTNTAGIILVKDGSTVVDGAAAAKTPSSVIYDGLEGTGFRTSVVVNFASGSDNPASDGKIEVLLHAMPSSVTW
jgi:hypothetical protein